MAIAADAHFRETIASGTRPRPDPAQTSRMAFSSGAADESVKACLMFYAETSNSHALSDAAPAQQEP